MAFESSAHGHIWTAVGAAWEFFGGEPEATPEGWDRFPAQFISYQPGLPMNIIAMQWPIGQQIPGLNFWVQSVRIVEVGGGLFRADLLCLGQIADKGKKIRWRTAVQDQSGENITISSTLYPRVSTLEAVPIVEEEQIIIGGTPNTVKIGDNLSPVPTPPVRSSRWASITDPTFHYPNGWVLIDLDAELLRNVANVWLERRAYQYIYDESP